LDQVVESMKTAFPEYRILPMKEYTTLMMSNYMSAFDAFIQVVVLVAVFIGVLVIFLSMYTTITERTREIGIFRSLGAPTSFIVGLIFQETALLCLVGAAIGVVSSFLIAHGVRMMFPTLQVMITPPWAVKASIAALLSALVVSLHPARRGAAQDPVEAFA